MPELVVPRDLALAARLLEEGYDVDCSLAAGAVDLAVVDALAQLRLAARLHGRRLRLREGDVARVRGLLALTGLEEVLRERSGVVEHGQVGGQPEACEQRRVEEVVDVGDAAVDQLEDLQRPGQPAARGVDAVLREGR